MLDEILEAGKTLPFKKRATPGQMLAVIFMGCVLFGAGWTAQHYVQGYFDNWHGELLASNKELLGAVQALGKGQEEKNSTFLAKETALSAAIDTNARTIDGLRRYYWSNLDQQQWVQQFDHLNRQSVPGMIVPPVPPPTTLPR